MVKYGTSSGTQSKKGKRDKKETVMGNLPVTFSYFFAR
jgi:hypothetical protein